MQMCATHWMQLRSDISKYGLDHLIAPSGEAAAEMAARQLQGSDGPIDFDPLMNANWQLFEIATRFLGLAALGDMCPACGLRDYNWVEGAAYQSRLYAEKNGLLLTETSPGEER